MLEANPALTPNLVKAILQYTAENRRRYDHFSEGAGFLNARGAVQLARAMGSDVPMPAAQKDPTPWSGQILWGNHRITGGELRPDASAWRTGVTWGAAATAAGEPIAWGTSDNDAHETVWGTTCADATCDTIAWGPSATDEDLTALWGATCSDNQCASVVWGSSLVQSADRDVVWARSVQPALRASRLGFLLRMIR
jgi:hypothetical protein